MLVDECWLFLGLTLIFVCLFSTSALGYGIKILGVGGVPNDLKTPTHTQFAIKDASSLQLLPDFV